MTSIYLPSNSVITAYVNKQSGMTGAAYLDSVTGVLTLVNGKVVIWKGALPLASLPPPKPSTYQLTAKGIYCVPM